MQIDRTITIVATDDTDIDNINALLLIASELCNNALRTADAGGILGRACVNSQHETQAFAEWIRRVQERIPGGS